MLELNCEFLVPCGVHEAARSADPPYLVQLMSRAACSERDENDARLTRRPKGIDILDTVFPRPELEQLIERPVRFASDCVGPIPESKSHSLAEGDILVLENVRFRDPEEEKNDEAFSKQLAALCDGVYVCDAFGSARARASVVGITEIREAGGGGAERG